MKDIAKKLREALGALKVKDYTNKTKRLLFEHHKTIVTAIMEQHPVLQVFRRADLQTHNFIADEESAMIELIRSGLL